MKLSHSSNCKHVSHKTDKRLPLKPLLSAVHIASTHKDNHQCRTRFTACRAAVGIDLGTSTSAIAYIDKDGQPCILEDQDGKAVIPSVVAFTQVS